MTEIKYKNFGVSIKGIDEKNYTIDAVFSTPDIDRSGEVVEQKSIILDEYLTNPVILFAHDHWQPAVAKTLSIGINEEGNLAGKIQFAVEEYPFAKILFNLYKGGYMRAFSIGFRSNEQEEKEEGGSHIIILKNNVIYEISAVNVGANARALAKSLMSEAQGKGFDTAPIREFMTEINKIEDEQIKKEIEKIDEKRQDLEKEIENKKTEIENKGKGCGGKKPSKPKRKGIQEAMLTLRALDNLLNENAKSNMPKHWQAETPQGRRKTALLLVNKAIRVLLKSKYNI